MHLTVKSISLSLQLIVLCFPTGKHFPTELTMEMKYASEEAREEKEKEERKKKNQNISSRQPMPLTWLKILR